MKNKEEFLALFNSKDGIVSIPVRIEHDTVWLSQAHMADLFKKERSVITKHIRNAIKEGEVEEKSNVHFLHIPNSDKPVGFYSLDVIISVGYRVKSQRGVEFRRWASQVLKNYLLKGYAVNKERLKSLGKVLEIMKRTEKQLKTGQVLSVIQQYTIALNLLDDYDHQRISKPKGRRSRVQLTYEECRQFIDGMGFDKESSLFGKEKDKSFLSSLGSIYQTMDGKDVYSSIEEKAAYLLYFIIKNHSFVDGNKRIAAALFIYFLDKNNALFQKDGSNRIDNHTLVLLTLLIAESKPIEREIMINLVMTVLTEKIP